MSESLIRVEGVSKKFCRTLKRSLWYGLQDLGSELLGRRHGNDGALREDEFWAVKDVGFELKRGECLALIGRNGAGKTTLLRMLNGLIKPDRGRIEMRGRVGALIALGAGFNPLLTGRENIYVNASVLGLSRRETDGKLEEIIDFAEIAEFIDMPVQSYSSGMAVRLGFAVATAITPDVLLVDEVLSVGDVNFRIKCTAKINELLHNTAVILVSHDAAVLSRVCSRGLLIDKGRVRENADIYQALSNYAQFNRELPGQPRDCYREQAEHIRVDRIDCPGSLDSGDVLRIRIDIEAASETAIGLVNVNLADSGEEVHAQVSCRHAELRLRPGRQQLDIEVGPLYLSNGIFFVNLVIYEPDHKTVVFYTRKELHFCFAGPVKLGASYYPPHRLTVSQAVP